MPQEKFVPHFEVQWVEIGVCGLSCKLCPMYYSRGESRCGGCKSAARMDVGCPFLTCAVKKRGIEFCWTCEDSATCECWRSHRAAGKHHDSFVCYQKLNENIQVILTKGIVAFEDEQRTRAKCLNEMLQHFNEGRSKTFYCIAATVLTVNELETALREAQSQSKTLDVKARSTVLHTILNEIAQKRSYNLKLRK